MLTLVVVALAPRAHAHRPFESTALLRETESGLELAATLSLPLAGALLPAAAASASPEGSTPLRPDTFEAYRTALLARLPALFALRSGDQVLACTRAALALSRAGEVEVLLEFPPRAAAGVEISAPFLEALPTGYFCVLRQGDAAGQPRARALLVRERSRATFVFPPVPPAELPASPATATPIAP